MSPPDAAGPPVPTAPAAAPGLLLQVEHGLPPLRAGIERMQAAHLFQGLNGFRHSALATQRVGQQQPELPLLGIAGQGNLQMARRRMPAAALRAATCCQKVQPGVGVVVLQGLGHGLFRLRPAGLGHQHFDQPDPRSQVAGGQLQRAAKVLGGRFQTPLLLEPRADFVKVMRVGGVGSQRGRRLLQQVIYLGGFVGQLPQRHVPQRQRLSAALPVCGGHSRRFRGHGAGTGLRAGSLDGGFHPIVLLQKKQTGAGTARKLSGMTASGQS